MSSSFAIPERLRQTGREWVPITLGESESSVWQSGGTGEKLFLKATPLHALSEHTGELERLHWLQRADFPAPRVVEAFEADGQGWMLMSALPGRDLSELADRPAELCAVLADGLRRLHAFEPLLCPFDRRLDAQLAIGAARVEAGLVDETDFDDARLGWSAEGVQEWLLANRPQGEDLVVCHGDASLPNVMVHEGVFSGVLDCGRLGLSDRWQDLAIACRSIIYNCGEAHVAPFLAAYGTSWDAERYTYYCTLDELF